MYISSFENCCGIFILSDFDCFDLQLTEAQSDVMSDRIKKHIKESAHVGALVAALNETQIGNGAEYCLLRAGFEKVGKLFNHPGHGRDIQMYQYCNYKDKATLKAERAALKEERIRRFG